MAEGRKKSLSEEEEEEGGGVVETRPALSAASQKVLPLFMVTLRTGCDPTGVPVL